MRVVESEVNQQFAEWLYQLSYTRSQHGLLDLPDWIQTTDDRQFFRQFIYPGHIIQFPNASFFLKRAILTSRNDGVDVFNREITDLTNSESHDYFALDTAQNDRSIELTDYTSEFLQAISGKGIPLGKLSLRVGMPIMLLRNYYPKQGLCNGCRLIVTRLFNHCIKAKIMSQDPRYNGREHIITRITLSTKLLKRDPQNPLPSQLSEDTQPPPIINTDGEQEKVVEKILRAEKRKRGRGFRRDVLVKWVQFKEPNWEPRESLEDTQALDFFENKFGAGDDVGEAIGARTGRI
ncbi:hypothetical protein EPUL_006383, partial [Erysiphe pulchra]